MLHTFVDFLFFYTLQCIYKILKPLYSKVLRLQANLGANFLYTRFFSRFTNILKKVKYTKQLILYIKENFLSSTLLVNQRL